jgi:hypothetical protein
MQIFAVLTGESGTLLFLGLGLLLAGRLLRKPSDGLPAGDAVAHSGAPTILTPAGVRSRTVALAE